MKKLFMNQRRSPRVPCLVSASWTRQGHPVELEISLMSAHGMFLLTDEDVLPGALMQLEVTLPDGGRPILLFASARSVGATEAGRGIGAEIYVISNHDRERWNAIYRAQRGPHPGLEGDPLRAIA